MLPRANDMGRNAAATLRLRSARRFSRSLESITALAFGSLLNIIPNPRWATPFIISQKCVACRIGVADLRYERLNMPVRETSIDKAWGFSTYFFHTLIKQRRRIFVFFARIVRSDAPYLLQDRVYHIYMEYAVLNLSTLKD
jgi:hypothetical protein